MESMTKLAQDIKATATALEAEQNSKWTGATILRTVSATETGLDYDVEILYFRLKDSEGAVYWVSEDDLDELTDEDMLSYL